MKKMISIFIIFLFLPNNSPIFAQKKPQIIRKDKRLEKKLIEEYRQLTRGFSTKSSPSFSLDGERIIYLKKGISGKCLCQIDKRGKKESIFFEDKVSHPKPSPNGKEVVLIKENNIFIYNIPENKYYELTSTRWDKYDPTWDAKGTGIAFAMDQSSKFGRRDIWIIDKKGENQKRLTHGFDSQPSFSIDGKLAFVRDDEIWIRVGESESSITDKEIDGKCAHPSFSPYGRKIVYQSDKAGNYDLWIINLDGTKKLQLTKRDANETEPEFSPTSSEIVFLSDKTGNKEICLIKLSKIGFPLTEEEKIMRAIPRILKKVVVSSFGNLTKRAKKEELGMEVSQKLVTQLAETKKVELLERGEFERVLKELELSMTGLLDGKEAIKVGKIIKANILILGSVSYTKEFVSINLRAIDFATSRVLFSLSEKCPTFLGKKAYWGFWNLDYTIEKIAREVVKKIYEK